MSGVTAAVESAVGGQVAYLGVRHHSPACARLVRAAIAGLRPAYVLVEGPSDMNGRLGELLLGHRLPVAVFSHYRDEERAATSWTPLCDYSPEWVALAEGRAAGAEVRFIDLPAWHPAFADRTNRFADSESRYADAVERLCRHFSADSVDALWDRLFEVPALADLAGEGDADRLWARLDAYFDVVRGDAAADDGDRAREAYMARWVRAAVAAADGRPVLVVTGGFHRPALKALTGDEQGGEAEEFGDDGWPVVPVPAQAALTGSYLVPYSFRQLDAFAGYQSGMPSPGFYQRVWEGGAQAAADGLVRDAVTLLRKQRHPVSTAHLIAARTLTDGLSALRGHERTARTDVLDGLAGALIGEALEQPLPWTTRGLLSPGSHPAVVALVAAGGGSRIGALHPDTPAPPLVHDVAARTAALGLDPRSRAALDLCTPGGLERSRVLHRLRVLGIPGHTRTAGPRHGADPEFTERWEPAAVEGRDAALVEAGAYGARLDEAAARLLAERAADHADNAGLLASDLFDTVLCGVHDLSGELLVTLADQAGTVRETGPLGELLATALGLWRHDRVYGLARADLLAAVLDRAASRLLWLVEGVRTDAAAAVTAGSRPGQGVDLPRLRALAALRDTCLYAGDALTFPVETVASAARRIADATGVPQDLRGAAFGLCRALSCVAGVDTGRPWRSVVPRGAALGDWLAGLFALARAELTDHGGELVTVLDEAVKELSEQEFLVGLPALRQAFAFFPPREREQIARRLLEARGVRGSARGLLRTGSDPLLLARSAALEDEVTRTLDRCGLGATTS